MCGRFTVSRDPSEAIARIRGLRDDRYAVFQPRYNVAPTQRVLAVINDGDRSARELRWGLIPPWVADPTKMKLTTFNARIETIATAPSYRSALRSQRAALPATGFFEWKKSPDGSKTPYWIHLKSDDIFFFAGLWERWIDRDSDGMIESCTIITQPSNTFMELIHSRMPVVLNADAIDEWLSLDHREAPDLLPILTPTPSNEWTAHRVSAAVGNVRNVGSELIEKDSCASIQARL